MNPIQSYIALVALLSASPVLADPVPPAPVNLTISQRYPFREGYPYAGHPGDPPEMHAVLSLSRTTIRRGGRPPDFTAEIRLYADDGGRQFYNVWWNELIPLPGQIALYDARKHYVMDLLQSIGGSQRIMGVSDWISIPAPGYVGAFVPANLPSVFAHVPPGMYYGQVIYNESAILPPPALNPPPFYAGRETFRSNAVKITLVE